MPPSSTRFRPRVQTAAAFAAAVAVAYGAGLVTGVVGSSGSSGSADGGVLDEAAARIAAQAAEPVDRAELDEAAVNAMLEKLGDRWSTYYGPTEFASFTESVEGRYTGIGVWIRPSGAGPLVISSVATESPADDAGLRSGDTLLAIDGVSTATASVADVVDLLRGDAGTTVDVEVGRAGTVREVSVVRTAVANRDVTVIRRADGITVVRVAAFTRGVGKQVRAAVDSAAGAPGAGVVLDLRGDSGGLLTEAVEVSSAFLDGGPVVTYERRSSGATTLDAVGEGDVDIPVVVLVDGDTASAAEVVAAALQDRDRAVVVGSQTFGKGSVQEPTKLSDGSAIELTVGRYLTPDGRSIDGRGVEPDVLVDVNRAPNVAERRAVEVLVGLQASVTGKGRG